MSMKRCKRCGEPKTMDLYDVAPSGRRMMVCADCHRRAVCKLCGRTRIRPGEFGIAADGTRSDVCSACTLQSDPAAKEIFCRSCRKLRPIEQYGRNSKGKRIRTCEACRKGSKRNKGKYQHYVPRPRRHEPGPSVKEIQADEIRRLADIYMSVRHDPGPGRDDVYRLFRDALREHGSQVRCGDRIWQYNRGSGDISWAPSILVRSSQDPSLCNKEALQESLIQAIESCDPSW